MISVIPCEPKYERWDFKMSVICEKCGHEVDGNSPICMYCGAALPDTSISQETKERLKAEEKDSYTSPNASSTQAVGAFLMILGILADVISMFLIFSDGFGSFGAITIGGTICFLIGIMLFSNG